MAGVPTPGRGVARSVTRSASAGRDIGIDDPLDKGYLCEHICECSAGTAIFSKSGQELKQRCVTARIWLDEEASQLVWRYKAEVGFNMKTNPPAPLMSRDQPNRPSRFPLGRAIGDGILKRNLEGRPQKGLLRIPDCIILKSTGAELAAMRASGHIDWKRLIPVKANIETVVEIKFDGDQLSRSQQEDYALIAGPDRFRLLKANDCECGAKRRRPVEEPVRSPVTTPMKRERTEQRHWYQPAPPKPAPAPRPVRPQYGPVASQEEGSSMSSWLKTAGVAAGVVLVGVIAVAALPAEAVAAGVALLVVGGAATAAPINKDKKP
ncbi:hypothetical protein HNQ59_000286 [Chitinivorax tropicus]|uniref:VRR-NUC domain-containing protein n=1 Tax=Chitinivorax tropicus TaxID=714531 RepID=A0A840MCI5_9PROT|nr:hypothetical protein [Chitinivorax tropicus]MBB5017024.1 hypothetical protein [Chitinivorax tropicus]